MIPLEKMLVIYLLFAHLFFTSTENRKPILENSSCSADLVVFSYDRPLQLYALLESIEHYITGIDHSTAIIRVSNNYFRAAYEEVQRAFPLIRFFYQENEPHPTDFKTITMQAAFANPSPYILFAMDDIIVKDFIYITESELLEKTGAYGFFLRLGKNLSECYTCNKPQKIPPLFPVSDTVYLWKFADTEHNWRYQNTVDMTIYRKRDLCTLLQKIDFENPSTLEANWHRQKESHSPLGLCYAHSKIVNIPLNQVQTIYNNRCMNYQDTNELLKLFMQGLKIDIGPLHVIDNKSAHIEYIPHFVKR
jgi:hypothetical protein